ncbi:MAG: hypothetical protein ACRDTV_18210 [Mycobacterium sp.]
MPPTYTIASLAGDYELSVREVQDCAREVGVSAQRGAAKLQPAQVAKLRPALASARSRKKAWAERRAENIRLELNNPVPEPQSADDVIHVECDCCQLRLNCRGDVGMPLCDYCRDHYHQPGESRERELTRLRDHDERMRVAFVRARVAADEYRMHLRRIVENRDDWREAAIKLVIDHTEGSDGRCNKCEQPFPCELVRILQGVNYGFARKAESWSCFSDEELDRHLHPNRARDRDYFAAVDDDDEEEIG